MAGEEVAAVLAVTSDARLTSRCGDSDAGNAGAMMVVIVLLVLLIMLLTMLLLMMLFSWFLPQRLTVKQRASLILITDFASRNGGALAIPARTGLEEIGSERL